MMRRKQDRIFSKIEGMEADFQTRPNPAAPPSKHQTDDSENSVGLMSEGVIGTGPAEDRASPEELIVLNSPDSFFAESCRFLRSKITRSSANNPPRSVLITSALPGEGKTLVACNLAVSISQTPEEFALLVDADLRNPQAHRVLGIPFDQRGLFTYLTGDAALSELLKEDGLRQTVVPRRRELCESSSGVALLGKNDGTHSGTQRSLQRSVHHNRQCTPGIGPGNIRDRQCSRRSCFGGAPRQYSPPCGNRGQKEDKEREIYGSRLQRL